ncbi:alpha-galactosidase [Cohnella nanjingensis]|uniref:Alpha-galactosidase n=1 Tax=Cohnella nanjingensis TaxID=1387779 RepID=A0A7X0VFI1_9BACL|nr:alpha-galactosidase [Cohnella nanjingensis]MBB6671318.1 alpha-galactosidase [Cohnella nanjingensis]
MSIARTEQENRAAIDNGRIRIACDLEQGSFSIEWDGLGSLRRAYGRVLLGGVMRSTADARRRSCRIEETADAFGQGVALSVIHELDGEITLRQVFRVYEGLPYGLIRLEAIVADRLSTNEIAPIYAKRRDGEDNGVLRLEGEAAAGDPLLALLVPFDNDKWVRYASVAMPDRMESYEATAVYRENDRRGFVFGSVSHETWKTGIQVFGMSDRTVDRLAVYGGAAGDYTRDTLPHGFVTGAVVSSPDVFAGAFADYRAGLAAFGDANARVVPALPWEGPVPFGWNSWSAVGGELTYDSYVTASDFIREMQGKGFHDRDTTYLNFDSFWTNLSEEERRGAVAHVHANGQKAGTYWTPFAYWGTVEEAANRLVEGTDGRYTYADLLLRDEAGRVLPDLDGGLAIDPSHPGNLMRTAWTLQQFVEEGFEYVKLDFMGHGALEGCHFLPEIETGVQAYNYGMRQILAHLDPAKIGRPFFIHLSIAPLFPHGYAHGRRISCDAFGELKDTAYMLNSLTYGWWIHRTLYAFNDPDHTVLHKSYNHPPTSKHEGRSRLNASLIAGTLLLMGDDYRISEARDRARVWLAEQAPIAIARRGETFLPLSGDVGDRATQVFYRHDRVDRGTETYVAVFNYDRDRPAEISVDLARMGLNPTKTWSCADLWAHTQTILSGDWRVPLLPAESKLFRLRDEG